MWKDTSEIPGILSGTQKAMGLGSKFSMLGNIRLLRQKSKAGNGVLSTTLYQVFWTIWTMPSRLPTTNEKRALDLLRRYQVKYVVVGDLERITYPGKGLNKFETLGRKVFENQGTAIYEARWN